MKVSAGKKQVIKKLSPKSLWQTYMKWTVDNQVPIFVCAHLHDKTPQNTLAFWCIINSCRCDFVFRIVCYNPILKAQYYVYVNTILGVSSKMNVLNHGTVHLAQQQVSFDICLNA